MTGHPFQTNIAINNDDNDEEKEADMRGMKRFGLLLTLAAVTACAPVVYDATYHAPVRHVSTHTTYSQPRYHHETVYRQAHPIEITLYAGNTYLGIYFQPVRLTITDGQYVEIPVRDRRGRQSRIFAHYHQNNLHFDADRNCQGIHGSSSFTYDNRWDKGHRYSNINVGKDYDLSGLQLQIRKMPSDSPRISKKTAVKVENTANQTRHSQNQPPANRPLVTNQEESKRRVDIVYNGQRPAERQIPVVVKNNVGKKAKNKDKYPIRKGNIVNNPSGNVENPAKRPAIVERISNDERSQQLVKGVAKATEKRQAASQKPTKGRSEDVAGPQSHKVAKSPGSADKKREEMLTQNEPTDEEDVANSRSNGKMQARERASKGKGSR